MNELMTYKEKIEILIEQFKEQKTYEKEQERWKLEQIEKIGSEKLIFMDIK